MTEPQIPGDRAKQGDRRCLTVRVLAWSLPALLVIGLVLYSYWYPFDLPQTTR